MIMIASLGLCKACRTEEAELGTRVCREGQHSLGQLCAKCASAACPHCGGKLMKADQVFPQSLFRAIETGDLAEARRLMRASRQDINEVRNQAGRSPLSVAAGMSRIPDTRRVETVECLLSLGALPQTADVSGRTPLMHAAMNRTLSRALAQLLKDSFDCQDSEGKTALMYAAAGHSSVNTRAGNRTVAKHLLDVGADPTIECKRRRTALGYALRANDRGTNGEMVDYLKQVMRSQAAQRIFESEYRASFDTNGALHVTRVAAS